MDVDVMSLGRHECESHVVTVRLRAVALGPVVTVGWRPGREVGRTWGRGYVEDGWHVERAGCG